MIPPTLHSGPAIDFWFDFSSSYAYFAAQEIEAMGRRVGRTIVWRPYMLGTAFKVTGSRGLSSTPLKKDYALRDWRRIAQDLGVPFVLPPHHPSVALPATRAFYWIGSHDTAAAVIFAQHIFRAYYTGNLDTADIDQVVEVAVSLGHDATDLRTGLADPAIKARATAAGDEAVARGVFGSPFFLVEDEPFWGWDRIPMMERWLRPRDQSK